MMYVRPIWLGNIRKRQKQVLSLGTSTGEVIRISLAGLVNAAVFEMKSLVKISKVQILIFQIPLVVPKIKMLAKWRRLIAHAEGKCDANSSDEKHSKLNAKSNGITFILL
jgi:predicted tellurium resistance membrane protein TerC